MVNMIEVAGKEDYENFLVEAELDEKKIYIGGDIDGHINCIVEKILLSSIQSNKTQ